MGKNETTKMHPPFNLHFHCRRHRLTDAEGRSAKAVIDGLVKAGLFPDDSPKYIKNVSYSQEKIPFKELESTIVEIEEA